MSLNGNDGLRLFYIYRPLVLHTSYHKS